jgi:hypothetical protein
MKPSQPAPPQRSRRRRRRGCVPPPGLPRWLVALAWAMVAMTVIVLFGVWPLSGGDLLMHLTLGRWIWHHGTVLKRIYDV